LLAKDNDFKAVHCNGYLVYTSFVSYPNRISIHSHNAQPNEFDSHSLVWDCDVAVQTAPVGSQMKMKEVGYENEKIFPYYDVTCFSVSLGFIVCMHR
jgi:hypothetical protein